MRILVVEDTKDLNLLIVKTLKKAGYSVDGCFEKKQSFTFWVPNMMPFCQIL